MIATEATDTTVRRDDKGRIIAEDGLPVSGLCSPKECSAVAQLAPSTIYAMMNTGELASKRFGRARRIPWSAVRELISAD